METLLYQDLNIYKPNYSTNAPHLPCLTSNFVHFVYRLSPKENLSIQFIRRCYD